MRRELVIILSLFFICCEKETLIYKDGIQYSSKTNSPYNGLWTDYDYNRRKVEEGLYKNGKKDSIWTIYYENGNKKKEGLYNNGEIINIFPNLWTYWYEDGRKIVPVIPEFIFVKGSTFKMGSNRSIKDGIFQSNSSNAWKWEKPIHNVTLNDYYISKTEITFNQYDIFCDITERKKPLDNGWGRGNRPVINVKWDDAVAFCNWLSIQTGEEIRLPTEAEWEFAAKGGIKSKGYKYSGSNKLVDVAIAIDWRAANVSNYEPRGRTQLVGQKLPNELGLYDMTGNVWEWCSDYFEKDYYHISPRKNPKGPKESSYQSGAHVVRGGAFENCYEFVYGFHYGTQPTRWPVRCEEYFITNRGTSPDVFYSHARSFGDNIVRVNVRSDLGFRCVKGK